MAYWFDATSSMLLDRCGETTSANAIPTTLPVPVQKDHKAASALDDTAVWYHDVNHTHWMKLDLGKQHYIEQIRGILNGTTNAQHVVFYVSNDPADYGDAVLDVPDWQNYSPGGDSYEYCLNYPKLGRYILIQILSTTDANNYLRWG